MSRFPVLRLHDNRFGDFALFFEKNSTERREEALFVSRCLKNDPEDTERLGGQDVSDKGQEILELFGKKTLGDLTELADGAIVDLSGSHLDNKERKKLRFFKYCGDENSFRLETSNLMGVLRFRGSGGEESLQVEVLSRFDRGENFFLNYLLSKAFDVSFANDSVMATQPSVLDRLLDVLFVRRLGEAAKNGLLRQYRTFRNNDWNFKGRLDLPRHIRENIPLPHGIAYVKREIDLDVPVNRLLLLAALVVRKRDSDLFERNEDARDAFRELQTAIPNPGDIRSVLSQRDNREPVRHPFYREIWEPLRKIARMILEEERWQLFRESDEEVSGVVFDGSWLWEEYVARVLKNAEFKHSTTEDGSVQRILPVFRKGSSRFAPDFYLEHSAAEGENNKFNYDCVLDAKYKRSNPNGGRNDVHQVLCYLLLTGAKLGGLVFPPVDARAEDKEDLDNAYGSSDNGDKCGWMEESLEIASPYSNKDRQIFWNCFSWAPVPEGKDWTGFCKYMDGQEQLLENIPTIK